MTVCEECELPMPICNALANYRFAVGAFERGDVNAAKDFVNDAKRCYDEYDAAMRAARSL